MIDILPQPYEDELFYSWLARCYVKNCYPDYKTFSLQVMGRRDTNPSFEFINKITEPELHNMMRVFTGGLKQIIDQHTLLPYYTCFIGNENRQLIYGNAGMANLPFDKLIGMPNVEHTKFLKYCPVCAREDREKYGEVYWKRQHQIIGMKACHIHRIKLIEGNVAMNDKVRWNMFTAELEIPQYSETEEASESEIRFATYAAELLELATTTPIVDTMTAGRYLSLRMIGTKYVTVRGNKRHVSMLNKDLNEYWNSQVPLYKMKKVVRGLVSQTNEIVALAIILDIPPRDLLTKENVSDEPIKVFDEKVVELYRSGKTESAIANILKISHLTVRNIIAEQKKTTS